MAATEPRESETAKLVAALRAELGETTLTTDPDVSRRPYDRWTRRFSGPAAGLTPEHHRGGRAGDGRLQQPRFGHPQGGNTSMVAGSVPTGAEDWQDRPLPIILSTLGLRRLDPVDTPHRHPHGGAGVTLAEVQHQAATAGWLYGVDLGARDTATIGGTCATNAGGIRVCAYGMTRRQVIGLEGRVGRRICDQSAGRTAEGQHRLRPQRTHVGSEGTLGGDHGRSIAAAFASGPSTLALVGVESMAAASTWWPARCLRVNTCWVLRSSMPPEWH